MTSLEEVVDEDDKNIEYGSKDTHESGDVVGDTLKFKDDTNSSSNTDITTNNTTNNDNNIDEIEKSLGILEYLSSQDLGFSAVVKARYSDFLVHEVDLNGKIAHLTSLEIPPDDESRPDEDNNEEMEKEEKSGNERQENSKTGGNEVIEKTDIAKEQDVTTSLDDPESQLAKMIKDPDIAKKVILLLKSHDKANGNTDEPPTNDTELEKYVTLPPLEKTERRTVHEWVRKSLLNARADTADGKIRIWHVKFEKQMPNYRAFGDNNKRNNNNNNNRRSNKRIKMNWPSNRPNFLRFVLYKENVDTTTATKDICCRSHSKARIGYAGMKDKRGITSQFCTLFQTTPQQIINTKQFQSKTGGGNTKQKGYSIIEVGNFEYTNQDLRLGMLKGNRFDIILRNVKVDNINTASATAADDDNLAQQRQVLEEAAKSMKDKGFINYFGTQRFGKFNNTHLVGIAVLQGNFRKAVDIMMEPTPDDRPEIVQARKDWNERFTYGENKENERVAAKKVLKRLNRFMTGEIAVIQCLVKHPMDYTRAFGCIPKNLRMMFVHAVQSLIWNRATSYRIASMDRDNVVVGDLVPQEGCSGGSRVHIITEEDIRSNRNTIEDVVLPMVGRKTTFPTNEMDNVIKKLLTELGISLKMFQKIQNLDRDLIIQGDYRKIICHPQDFDYTIKEYYDPLQPLMQTDLMKLSGEDIVIEAPKDDKEISKLAMIVGFTLPSSSYATIALRELMKRPTSNKFQKELTLE